MFSKNNHNNSRALSMFLVMLMVLSTTAALATTASASIARSYTTNRDPLDVALGDFNCDGFNDMAVATEGTHTITILWNDGNGDFSERQDIWVSQNQSRNADWDEFSNVQFIEVGEFTGDGADDIVIFQRNNPFKTDDNGNPAGQPGNVTIIENGGCSEKTWSIGQRFTHFWAWDLAVGDADQDGNDDVYILDLLGDLSSQRVVTYRGPIGSSTQGIITTLGPANQNTYRSLEVGDHGETETGGLSGTCTDDDIYLLRSEGLDYATNQVTNPGKSDNVSIIEFSCLTNTYPATYNFNTASPQTGTSIVNMNVDFANDFDIGDIDGNGEIDAMVLNDGNVENVSFVTSSSVGTWSTPALAYFGPYISYSVTVTDLNNDGEPDFVNPTIAYQQNSSDSAGGTTSNFFLNFPTTVQVTLSDGSGGHLTPLSYEAGRRPSMVEVGQLAGASNSALDIVVGHTSYSFGSWVDNFGWEGQYDTLTVVEMDSKDLSVSSLEISPTDNFFGIVGEGTRDINVTVTNTGMDILNGQSATLDLELKIVDETSSTNNTVYQMDWDNPEDKTGCGSGCSWAYEEYIDQATKWHEETNHSQGASDGNNDPNVSANYLNPTDFMWAGHYKTNSSGDLWSGYDKNWDDAMVLEDVDLTGSDRAFMSVELFRHLGHGVLGSADATGNFIAGDVWDDIALIEIGSEESGWDVISCPQEAYINGACASGTSMWGGFDLDRQYKQALGGVAEGVYYYGVYSFGTNYGWSNFTEEGVGAFDLSPWAGETVDVRFRFRTGFEGSISDDNESQWTGRDGYAVDNLTIWKQSTAFLANPQIQQSTINLNNLGPGQEYTTSISADLLNDTTYRISASLSGNSWDEQPQNDELVGYITPFNLYDPTVEGIEYFNPGGLYAEGLFDIDVTTNNFGNTEMDFDVKATVFSATPSDVYCGTPNALCEEDFEGGANGYRYTESANPKGVIYDETTCQDTIFNNNAYWFGHPCDTGSNGYGDAWANETLTIPDIDLTSMSGDFVSLNFEYYADTFYGIDSDGTSIVDVNDYAAMTLDILRDGATYSGVLVGQWNDYNEDGTCQIDENGDNIVNASEPIDNAEISYIGDDSSTDGTGGNYNVFFNTNDLVATTSIDLTHLYVLNTSDASSINWGYECMSLSGSVVDINFEFQSDDDGRNGVNDGFKGVAFNNISLQEYTFIEDNSYTISRTNVDAEGTSSDTISSHEFFAGVYMIEAETIFDNQTQGVAWYNVQEMSTANNIERVIFNVESVDITLGKPNVLGCLSDQVLECVMPIDSSYTHDWAFQATNGVLAGDYIFNMNIFDETTQTMAHTTTAGPSQTLDSHQRIEVTFTPWNGWMDGHEYNISFDAELANGNPSGNVRYFHATFADNVDVAILSDTSVRTTAIKEDLDILGMSYTQYTINDWDTYLDAGWFTHYDKIVLPWQDDIAAKDIENGGRGYYQKLGSTAHRTTLEGFMSAGGTIQAHLGPQGSQIYGVDQGLSGRLPFGLDVQSRNTPESRIDFSSTDFADPYHPLMDNVDINAFQGFDADSTVAQAVLNTKSVSANNVPVTCNGYMEDGGYFQRLIRDADDIQDTVLGVCSYYSGGMIVSTMDVSTHSERADSSTLPLLGNMLSYQVTPYPEGFGTLGNGLDLKINDQVPGINPSTGGYELRYMKSDADLTFSYSTTTTETLHTDWIVSGPTSWDGSTMATGMTGHNTDAMPIMNFCKIDLSSATGCAQGEQWTITLMLHDDAGHSRVIEVTVETNDVYADEYRPTAEAMIDMRDDYTDLVEYVGTKTVSNTEWAVNRIILDEDGEVTIHFDASNSSDLDALEGTGIETYEWKVLFDAPYGDDSFSLDGHTFEQNAASNGAWAYTFRNVTVDPSGTTENQIRIELIVYDKAGKFSEKYRMY
ncbi:MAG: VCBS repeat-containing protein, partial [Euryarchaeota archaeon]|nr:VCBS repeat-containing protein [Euryarchaeota archaeon]